MVCAKAGDQRVFPRAEAWGTRKEGGWSGVKRGTKRRSWPFIISLFAVSLLPTPVEVLSCVGGRHLESGGIACSSELAGELKPSFRCSLYFTTAALG